MLAQHGVVLLNALSNGALALDLGDDRAEVLQLDLIRSQTASLEVLSFRMGWSQRALCLSL